MKIQDRCIEIDKLNLEPQESPKMASYAKMQTSNKNQVSVMAQAKPAIISASSKSIHDTPTGLLSEKMKSALRFSSTTQVGDAAKFILDQKPSHIEDDSIIQRQNTSNQMRQAAVMAAVACQQKVRLSATERLALTAKKHVSSQQYQQQQQPCPPQQLHQPANNAPVNLKPAPLPTLETLLAVQRQLQQHTKQNLNYVPQQVVNNVEQESTTSAPSNAQQRNKPLPPSPPKSPSAIRAVDHVTPLDTYDKDLPPLPASISPSTTTDDSQMNSLESHQSSPETSLVSLPPPPPPLSAYLQQYDEVTSCERNSSSSSPSNASSTEVSSVKHYPAPQVKPILMSKMVCHNYDLPVPFKNSPPKSKESPQPPALAPKPKNYLTSLETHRSTCYPSLDQNNDISQTTDNSKINLQPQQISQARTNTAYQHIQHSITSTYETQSTYKPQIDYQQHFFTLASSCLPPTTTVTSTATGMGGYDQPDSGNIRFPTPPPPEMLLDDQNQVGDNENDDDEDDDFQCNIPTPPLYKSMTSVSFPDCNLRQHSSPLQFQNQQNQNQQQQQPASPAFNSSTFSVSPTAAGLQPPPLFRHQIAQNPIVHSPTLTPAQLTVHINNNGGLLSTTNSNHRAVNHHHDHIMMTMTASSSSPSSSSDGDGQSSNSSSSTSGIHSSIDSPSSSNSKLDDFNYGGKLNNSNISSIKGLNKPLSNISTSNYESHLKNDNGRGCISDGSQTGKPGLMQQTNSISNITTNAIRRPALKQKKTVSFSDKVELVACAEEQSEDHLPNPLLARVLAGKLQ